VSGPNFGEEFWRRFETNIWRKWFPRKKVHSPFHTWRLITGFGFPFDALFNPIEIVEEDDTKIIYRVVLPGISREQITLGATSGELIIKIHPTEDEKERAEAETLRRELPNSVDVNEISASLKLGILTITALKKNANRRTVAID